MFPGDAAAAGRDHTESRWLRLSLEGVLGGRQQGLHGTNRGLGLEGTLLSLNTLSL